MSRSELTLGFSVGEYIADELEARGWTTRDCAERITDDPKEREIWELTLELQIHVDRLKGVIFDREFAEALSRAFGTSVEVWLRLDAEFKRVNGLPATPSEERT